MNVRLALLIILVVATNGHADIFRWDTGELIPGTEGIEPGPGVDLGHSDLGHADLVGANLSDANLEFADLENANLKGADLHNTNLSYSTLRNADLTSATLVGADLRGTITNGDIDNGFTKEQFYSTASYQEKSLQRIQFPGDIGGWDLSGQDLTSSHLNPQADTNLTNAVVIGVDFGGGSGPTAEQLYSTASFEAKNLTGVRFGYRVGMFGLPADLTGWSFRGQDLRNAFFYGTLANVDFVGADLRNTIVSAADATSLKLDSTTIYNQWTVIDESVRQDMTLVVSPPGDFDADDELNGNDVNLLGRVIRGRKRLVFTTEIEKYDLNSDGWHSEGDLVVWITMLKKTWFGDSNLDGEFNSGDLVEVFGAGEYEDAIEDNSGWAEGDWNADGEFDSSDLVVAFADGGYEQGPRVNAVPEPSTAVLLLVGMLALVRRRN